MQNDEQVFASAYAVTAVALAVCLPVSAYAETETTEEAAAPAVVEEATQDNTSDEAASEDSASCVRVVDVTIFMDTTKGHFESDPDNVALTYLNRAEFEETPITLPTVIANEGWEFKGWDVWGKEHFVLGADATELGHQRPWCIPGWQPGRRYLPVPHLYGS